MNLNILLASVKYPQGPDPSGFGMLAILVFLVIYGIYAAWKYIKRKLDEKD